MGQRASSEIASVYAAPTVVGKKSWQRKKYEVVGHGPCEMMFCNVTGDPHAAQTVSKERSPREMFSSVLGSSHAAQTVIKEKLRKITLQGVRTGKRRVAMNEFEQNDDLVLKTLSYLNVSETLRYCRLSKRWRALCERTIRENFSQPGEPILYHRDHFLAHMAYIRKDLGTYYRERVDELAVSYGYPRQVWDVRIEYTKVPRNNDVVLPYDYSCYPPHQTLGNAAYKVLIQEVSPQYIRVCKTKEQRDETIESLLDFFYERREGQFLDWDDDINRYFVISRKEAKIRVRHSLVTGSW